MARSDCRWPIQTDWPPVPARCHATVTAGDPESCLCLKPSQGQAQSNTTGGLEGTVTDAAGATLSPAFASLHAAGPPARSGLHSATRQAVSASPISIPILTLLTPRASNFAPWIAPSVAVQVGQITTLAPHLAVAGHSETCW